MDWAVLAIWIKVALTLIILSFLYRDNPLYKLAEHLFVGLGTGYFIIQQYRGTFVPNLWTPFTQALTGRTDATGSTLAWDFALAVPFAFGVMFFFKFANRTSWMARWPMAVVIGTFAGLAVIGFAQGDLIKQTQANLLPLLREGAWQNLTAQPSLAAFFQLIWNPVLIVGVLSALVYFFFSTPHTGVTGRVATLGIWFLMMSFGASYGSTVMTRISLFLERATSTIVEETAKTVWLAIVLVAVLVVWRFLWAERASRE
jgi:hypothetical protein